MPHETAPSGTHHRVLTGDARDLAAVPDGSVHLIVTSPPYPMVQMWDEAFAAMSPVAGAAIEAGDGPAAFEAMHLQLDAAWRECHRVLIDGGIACVNIGDAVRTVDGTFRMYANHARVIAAMGALGFHVLPDILWRKPTNAPTKFMGSGMLPGGAYVTYEHEYILIFRRGPKRAFRSAVERRHRRASAYFWEERNAWFSDVWADLPGRSQGSPEARTGAYPSELAYRLICMYSLYGETVLDPFLGTGSTTTAAIAAGRDSIGVEIRDSLRPAIDETVEAAVDKGRARAGERLAAHRAFIEERLAAGKPIKHSNIPHGFPVVTAQETGLELRVPETLRPEGDGYQVGYGVL